VLRTSRTPLPTLRTYVWVGPNAPSDARARLTGAGLKINGTESVAARRHQLDREGTALALGIFLVAALAAVLLAGGALLATTTAAARRRSYELASLRVLGARDRVLVAASRRELLALVLVAVVVGAVCGLVGARLVIPTLPAVDGEGSLVHANYGPAWLAVLAVAVAVLAVGWLVAQVSARRTVRLAMLDRLREAEG
jgi:ABC-type antimicrobial peptide transport system permease subunit